MLLLFSVAASLAHKLESQEWEDGAKAIGNGLPEDITLHTVHSAGFPMGITPTHPPTLPPQAQGLFVSTLAGSFSSSHPSNQTIMVMVYRPDDPFQRVMWAWLQMLKVCT